MAVLSDLSDDLQVSVLSFLSPPEASPFSASSRRSRSLFSTPSLFLAMCDRRWGHLTAPSRWIPSPSASTARRLYSTLSFYAPVIGLWRQVSGPRLVHFSWATDSISAGLVSPTGDAGRNPYAVVKVPFLRLLASLEGEPVAVAVADGRSVDVGFMGSDHLVVAGKDGGEFRDEEARAIESTSPPDNVMLEIYRHFANPKQSPGGSRRRGKGRGKGMDWETEHFVRIAQIEPTGQRPLQGLWKGICENMDLEFYLITYDEIGGLSCRRFGTAGSQHSGFSPVFWTSGVTFLDPPFPKEELDLYCSRYHIRGASSDHCSMEEPIVSRIMCVSSSYDIVLRNMDAPLDTRNVDGRIWLYENGTFGFGFVRNNFIIDLKPIFKDGTVLDIVD